MKYLKYVVTGFVFLIFVFILTFGSYYLGYLKGLKRTGADIAFFDFKLPHISVFQQISNPQPTPIIIAANSQTGDVPSWGGPELWELVNQKRKEYGVNPLANKSEVCTIAAIRLNQLLALGTLDGHEGFGNMPESRADLMPIFEKYNLTEFLVSGAKTPEEAVSSWENTLGHKKLLTGGEYVWGCIYAQSGFAVAITAY